jgi:predicted nuclease with TOPRIM domain
VSEDEPKSAVEIAMAKLRARGDFPQKPLTDEQKSQIAEIRTKYKARIAELEIKQQDNIKRASSYEELESLKGELVTEKARLNEKMEAEVRKVRGS